MPIRELKIADITVDDGILLRPLDEKLAKQYAEAMRHRDPFPPIDVFDDGETCWCADGRHRIRAALIAKRKVINAVVQDGGFREALLFAAGANETHGERRTNAVKRAYVRRILIDDEWRECSNRELARIARVSHQTVVNIRGKMEQAGEIEPRETSKRRKKARVSKIDTPKKKKKKQQRKRPKPRTQDQIHEEEAQSSIDITRKFPHDGREGARRWPGITLKHARYMRDFWAEFVAEREKH